MSVALQIELSDEDAELILHEASRHALSVGDWLRSLIQPTEARSSRTLEQLGREVEALRSEIEALKQREPTGDNTPDRFAGCFTDDPDWAAIHQEIEARRRIPAGDPE
jgi:hypothetical protein